MINAADFKKWLDVFGISSGGGGGGGTVSNGTINEMAYYAATGDTVSGLATANNGTLITSAAGVPSISSTLPSTVQTNITELGTIDQSIGFSGTTDGAKYLYIPSETTGGTTRLTIQAGAGSAAFGGGLSVYGAAHATKAGWVTAGISSASSGKFSVSDQGTGGGVEAFTVDKSGNVVANGSLTAASVLVDNLKLDGNTLSTTTASDLQLTPLAGNELDINFSSSDILGVQIRGASATANPRLLFYRGSTTFLSGLYAGQNDTFTGTGNGVYLRNGVAGGKIFLRDSTGNALAISAGNTTLSGSLTAASASFTGDITVNTVNVGLGGGSIATNTGFGVSALNANTTGKFSTGIGYNALSSIVSNDASTAVGYNCLKACLAVYNSGLGASNMEFLTSGQRNTAFGAFGFYDLTTGSYNTGLGMSVGRSLATGSASLVGGNYNTLMGYQAGVDNATAVGTLALGADAVATKATGATSGDDGPGIAIGSAAYKVGFRGDGTIYPSAGTSAGYLRVKVNGVQYKLLLMADA